MNKSWPIAHSLPGYGKLWEIVCVVFGHQWLVYGSETRADGLIKHQWKHCTRCSLEWHDRRGLLIEYREKHGNASGSSSS